MPFPEVIDSSIVNTWRSCQEKARNTYMENLGLPGLNIHLHFGGCFAKGLEVARRSFYIDGLPEKEAVQRGTLAALQQYGDFEPKPREQKTWGNLALLLLEYFKKWPMASDVVRPWGEKAIEFSFAIPLHGIKHPDTGGDLCYAGRFDMLGSIKDTHGELIMPVDEKTTGRPLNEEWSKGWNIRGQFIGYIWGCQVYGLPVSQALVRGCSITAKGADFTQCFVPAHDFMIQRWYTQLEHTARQMIEAYQKQEYELNLGDACKDPISGRLCIYQPLCEARRREDWVSLYEKKPAWSPLRRPGGEP